MAVRINPIQRTTVTQASPGRVVRAAQTSAGDIARGVQDVGDAFFSFQDEVDTAVAKKADADFSELIREGLYKDGTGYMYSEGANAVQARESVSESINRAYDSLLEGMHPRARAKAQTALNARKGRAFQIIDQHASAQGKVFHETASAARITSSINDAIFDPDSAAASMQSAYSEIDQMASRQGWAPEVVSQKKAEARTSVHAGIIGRLEVVDPERALRYLAANRDQIDGAVVEKLESALAPKVRESRGRRLGQAAARGDEIAASEVVEAGAGYTVLRLADGQTVRREGTRAWRNNNPGNIEFGPFARSQGAVGTDGRFAIFPSYQAGRKAKAALIFDGSAYRGLSISDAINRYAPPSENDSAAYAAQVASAAGVSTDAIMGDLSASQREAVLDAMERVEGFRVGNESGGSSRAPSGIEDLLGIEDADVRDAAIREYNLLAGVKKAQAQAAKDAAAQQAFQVIEGGGNIDDLPTPQRQALGLEAMASLRTYQDKLASGQAVQTNDEVFVALAQQMANDPQGFMNADPLTWRADLDDGDFEYFVKQHSDMIAGRRKAGASTSVSSIRTAAKSALAAAGIDGKPKQVAAFETDILRWASRFEETEGRQPTPMELNDRINMQLVPVVLDPSGLGNKQSGALYTLDFDGEALDPNDDLRPEDIQGGSLQINGTTVSDEIIRIFAQTYNDRYGRAPTVQEAVEGLIESGVFND